MQELQNGDDEFVFSYEAEVMSFSNRDFFFSYSVRFFDYFSVMYHHSIRFCPNFIFPVLMIITNSRDAITSLRN